VSQRDHDVIEELLAVDALDGLSPEDHATLEQELAAHGDCQECRRLEVDFHDTAGRLAFALEPVAVDPSMAERILMERTTPPVPIPEAPVADELAERRTKRGRLVTAVVGIAAAFALIVGAFAVAVNRGGGTTVASASPEQTIVRFTPTADGEGELAMAYTPGQSGVVLWGSGLPDPGEGKTYEIWMISGDQPVSGGCVTPVDGSVAVFVDANIGTADTMAVTAEPGACPSAPTGAPLLTAPLTA
jgi:anti-sigma-K factor RskA